MRPRGEKKNVFERRFAVDRLETWLRGHPDSALATLFDRWSLPGTDAGSHGLRIGIRNDYLNLYVKGQSVAVLSIVRDEPRLELHEKYHAAACKGSTDARDFGQKYRKISGEEIAASDAKVVDSWIRTAETYAGEEKRFVDELVTVTPGTLDLEMALPADKRADGKESTAPRVDLVVAQGTAIAFWEAKCATNGELRSNSPYQESKDGAYEKGPHVLWQLRRYQRWVGCGTRSARVRDAYVSTAKHLLDLAQLFDKRGAAIDEWRRLADAGETAKVILPPGIVVAGYCPTRADERPPSAKTSYAASVKSFDEHEKRLTAHGATVEKVLTKPSGPVLPELRCGTISATVSTG